ncbi:MAG: binding-protein-dependent transport system inner rane component [candidate division NC10 bacterium]|jgi:peptide/nickel transport system permease protein|nr:binding-protein-dependent transport system inner rane component [candidate division NC10 bacterium]
MASAIEAPSIPIPAPPSGLERLGRVWRQLRRNRLSLVGSLIVLSLVLVALAAPVLGLSNPVKLNIPQRFLPPGPGHWFGTDQLGRDVLSRVVYGARVSLMASVLTMIAAGLPGVLLGIAAGVSSSRISGVIMRVMDLLMSFPPLLLAVAVAAALGTGTRSIIIALGVVYLPRIVRVTRGISLSVVAQEYVLAARALGSPRWRLILRTVLPNCLSVVVVQLSLYFAEVLLAEAALSFLGLGEPPPTPTWGNVLQDSQKYIRNAPWIAIFPGCAIAVSVLGLNLFGDAVRDAMDPRLRT